MRLDAPAVARIAAAWIAAAKSTCKRNALLVPGDRAAVRIGEADGASAGDVLAGGVFVDLDTGSRARNIPIRIGTAARVGKRDTPSIPRYRAALWIHEADRIAARWVDRTRGRVSGKWAALSRAPTDSDAHIRRESCTPSIPSYPAAIRLDTANRS